MSARVKDILKRVPARPYLWYQPNDVKPVDMYCKSHDDVGCSTCIAAVHRSCQDLFYIPEYVQDNNFTWEFENVQKDMQDVVSDLKTQLDFYQREIKRLFQRKEEEVEKIKTFRVQIDRRLDALEKGSIDEIEQRYQELIKKIESDMCVLAKSQQDVNSSHDSIISAEANPSQQFLSVKQGKIATDKAKKCLEEKIVECTRQDVVFECDKKLQSLLAEIGNFGKIIEKHVLCKLDGRELYNIKHESDRSRCDIHSICILPDGTVILADYSNENLKRLDSTTYIVDDVFELSDAPWQVCTVEKKEIAVSFAGDGDRCIQVMDVEGKLKKVRKIKTDHSCCGIAYNNRDIYVTDSLTTLYVYSMTGTKLKQFNKDQWGQPLFSNIFSIAISNNGKRIYVADSVYGLIVLHIDGTLVGNYKYSELRNMRRICETHCRHVFACGVSSNNIIQFAPNGALVGEVLSPERTGGCQALCFNRQSSRLIVGREHVDKTGIFEVV